MEFSPGPKGRSALVSNVQRTPGNGMRNGRGEIIRKIAKADKICINVCIYIYLHHGVSSSASSETTDIFHLGGLLKLFLIYFTICPSPILQAEWFEHWRREVYCPDEDHTQLDLDHHSFSISKSEVCPNKSKLSQFDDFLRMVFWIGWKECPPV